MHKTMVEAIRESLYYLLEVDEKCYVIGEGVPDPKCIFGSTKDLGSTYPKKVFDMPVSENALTGVTIGSAITGMKPIIIHQRIDFMMYAMDQIVNNAAKWYSMFGGQASCVPVTMRCIIGRGWGQGNQHSQNLSYMFAGMPGLKVVAPSNAYNAKGLLIASHRDNNPVIFIEHRWCHNTVSEVPDEPYEIELGKANVIKEGKHITIVCWSYMVLEVLKASEFMSQQGINAEIIDLQTISPIDYETVYKSLQKTGKLLVVEESWEGVSISSEIIAQCAHLNKKMARVMNPFYYAPSTHGLVGDYYIKITDIITKVGELLWFSFELEEARQYESERLVDVPDKNFTGPF